jgi:hypothetical protein
MKFDFVSRRPDRRRTLCQPRCALACLLLLAGHGVLPADAQETMSPFGIGSCYINGRSKADNARWIPQMAAIGLHELRSPHTSWNNVEPRQGQWTWEALDEQMAYLESNRMRCGGLLLGSVPWDKASKGLPVDNLPAWSQYVSQVVKHLKGRVKYWEVWNEPPNFIGKDQTPADYAKIVVAAYDAAKAANPDCLVGLAAKSVHVNYLEQVIQAGAKDHFDYITLHPYEVLGTVSGDAGTEALYMNIVPVVRKMLAAQNPAKRNVPILFTEIGSDGGKDPERQASALVKAYTMGIAQGVACIQWFEGRDGDSGPMGLIDQKGNPRPAYHALANLIQHLGQHPAYLGWVLLNDKHYAFVFQGERSIVLVTWAYRGAADAIDLGRGAQIIDPMTGDGTDTGKHPLTSKPILIIDPPKDLIAQARSNVRKPLPWGGDYSAAKSVSIAMGEKNVEKGLHNLSGDAVAADVVAYGGPARSGGVPGGNAFVVDPQFLSYSPTSTPTPIEVTIVVRRNPANDNAGFKLVYESTRGYKNFGWYTVPDNKQWHTIQWKITDAEFVGMWGYNFALESDGNQYNKYFIQSVTVTKVDP